MDDPVVLGLMRQLGLHCRRKVVSALLAGNDTCRFTTEQYAQEYVRQNRLDDQYREGWLKQIRELASMHLLSVGCRQVKLGVWTKPLTRGG